MSSIPPSNSRWPRVWSFWSITRLPSAQFVLYKSHVDGEAHHQGDEAAHDRTDRRAGRPPAPQHTRAGAAGRDPARPRRGGGSHSGAPGPHLPRGRGHRLGGLPWRRGTPVRGDASAADSLHTPRCSRCGRVPHVRAKLRGGAGRRGCRRPASDAERAARAQRPAAGEPGASRRRRARGLPLGGAQLRVGPVLLARGAGREIRRLTEGPDTAVIPVSHALAPQRVLHPPQKALGIKPSCPPSARASKRS
jgi:hypothetical protein